MTRAPRGPDRLVEAALRLVLLAYPRRFRRRFEQDVLAAARASIADAGARGAGPRLGAAGRELGTAIAGIVPQHRLERLRQSAGREGLLMRVLRSLAADARFAARSLIKTPAFTAVVLLLIALGIGASTAIFSVADAVAIRPLPYDDSHRLVAVLEHDPTRPRTFGGGRTTVQNYLDWRRLQQPFEAVALAGNARFWLQAPSGELENVFGMRASHEFFGILRARPLHGRLFTRDDEVPGRHRVVVLSHAFWQRWFGGDPAVVGGRVDLSSQPFEVIGVLPPGFSYPSGQVLVPEYYVPIAFSPASSQRQNSGRNYNDTAIARLKPGVTMSQAHEQMTALAAALDAQYPDWYKGGRARVIPLREHLVGGVRTWMVMLLAAVALLLLIACANVANLLLARATVRSRDVALRAALGASRQRLAQGLLVESLILSLSGAALGLAVAAAGVRLLQAWLPEALPRLAPIGIDWRVLTAAAVAAVATGLLFGSAPALHAARSDLTMPLRHRSAASAAGRAGARLRGALVVGEVALATILVVGAGLFLASFVTLVRVDHGFDHRNLLTLSIGLPHDREDPDGSSARNLQYVEETVTALRAIPGITAAEAVSGGVPLSGSWSRTSVTLPGRGELTGDDEDVDLRQVTPGYLAMLRVPLLAGRHLSPDDHRGAAPVIVVNDTAARLYWPDGDALGQRVTIQDVERTVVGVVGSIRHGGPETAVRQEAYIPLAQDDTYGASIVARTSGDPATLLPAVKAAIWRINPSQRFFPDKTTLEGYMDQLIAQRRFTMAVLALFGLLGLAISAAGIYGVVAYLVSLRTPEFGVRMALGASRPAILRLVARSSARLVAAGLVLGLSAAWLLGRLVEAFLFQVEAGDPRVFAGAMLVLALTGLAAAIVPARRASAVDPLTALRE